jgi:hypothetical protein
MGECQTPREGAEKVKGSSPNRLENGTRMAADFTDLHGFFEKILAHFLEVRPTY